MMRAAVWVSVGALVLAACGGGQDDRQATTGQVSPGSPDATDDSGRAADPSRVVEVRMTGDGTTTAQFEPDSLTIAQGTTLRFVNVAGWPHNMAFWDDSIPGGAREALERGMANTIGPLQGALLTEPGATYEVSFSGAPTGQYKGYCVPHLALGMRIWITVE